MKEWNKQSQVELNNSAKIQNKLRRMQWHADRSQFVSMNCSASRHSSSSEYESESDYEIYTYAQTHTHTYEIISSLPKI